MTDPTVYDECFTIKENRWGTFVSYTLDGRAVITAGNHEACLATTRFHLKGEQEGFPEAITANTDAFVEL